MRDRRRRRSTPDELSRRLPGAVLRASRGAEGLSLALLDAGVVLGAWTLASLAAMRASGDTASAAQLASFVTLATVAQLVGHRLAGMYGPVWEYASVDEAFRVAAGVLGGTVLAVAAIALVGWSTSTGYPMGTAAPLAALVALVGCGGIRFQARLFAAARREPSEGADRLRTLIVGAGATGASLAHELSTTDVGRQVMVVGFVDQDKALARRSVRGIPVLGSIDDLDQLCATHRIDRVLITTTIARPDIRSTLRRALATKAQVKVLPPRSERVDGPLVRNLRDLDVGDLLGRDPAPVDSDEIGEYLRDATVLITGAGGSIGSEIARQVIRYQPARILLLDRDETLLHDVVIGPLADPNHIAILGDICDTVRIARVFEEHRPDVVFHAAAQKHVPILERFPAEAVRVNVLGTLTLAREAAAHGCRFVHISTDKAADPCSVMGASKRAAEQVVFEMGQQFQVPFVAVRFGNVLASRGSVVPTFLRQIIDGGPVTVTDPEMTRYFMTIPEAVSLVLQSGAMADAGRVYLLDMGEPVSILTLAHQMIRLAGLRPGEDVAVEVVGIRPGERLHERLHDDAEVVEATAHPSISALDPKATRAWEDLVKHLAGLSRAVEQRDDDQARGRLEDLLRSTGVDCSLREGGPGHQLDDEGVTTPDR